MFYVGRCWGAMYFSVLRTHIRTLKIVSHALSHAPQIFDDRTRTRTRTFLYYINGTSFKSPNLQLSKYTLVISLR